jgi:APA family basic amino acid/polyamine antiporter
VPFVWPVSLAGAGACVFVMYGLPAHAWGRFGIWLAIGLVLYFAYGYRHSVLRRHVPPVNLEEPPGIIKK